MSSAATAGYAGTAAAAEDRGCSPELEDGQREERDAAPGAPQTAGGTAAALAVEAAEHVEGGADDQNRDLGKDMLSEIMNLKQKQKEAREAKLAVGKQLRNAERRRKRLKQRARQLSDSDLLAVISLRSHEKALGHRDCDADKEDKEDAESNAAHPGAAFSSGAAPAASRTRSSKKPRGG